MEKFPSYQILKHKNGKLIKGVVMCDNCKVKQRAIDVQRTVIDRQDAQIGRQQITIGELQTENAALRTTIANTYARLQQMIDNAEAEIRRREESILCLMEARNEMYPRQSRP